MKKVKVTIGNLLDKGLIKKTTKVKININDLRDIHLIKPLSKTKLVSILQLEKRGFVK